MFLSLYRDHTIQSIIPAEYDISHTKIYVWELEMTITALEALKIWKEGFENGSSDAVSKIITDDFIFIGGTSGTRSREETLTWVSSTPDLIMDDLEVLYENNEVMVCLHSVVRAGVNGQVMAFARKKDAKLSYWRVVRSIKPQ